MARPIHVFYCITSNWSKLFTRNKCPVNRNTCGMRYWTFARATFPLNLRQSCAFFDFWKTRFCYNFYNIVLLIIWVIIWVPMEHIVTQSSLDFKQQIVFICSIRFLNILEVIATSFSKIAKHSTLIWARWKGQYHAWWFDPWVNERLDFWPWLRVKNGKENAFDYTHRNDYW